MDADKADRILEAVNVLSAEIAGFRVLIRGHEQLHIDKEARLRKIEAWQNATIPILSGLTFVATLVANWIAAHV